MANEIQILNNGDTLYNIRTKINDNFALTKEFIMIMPFDQTIPVNERINNKLYFQYTDIDNTQGRFEDYEGNILVASSGGIGAGGLPMFTPVWSDHLYNDVSYLRADTFSWHSANIYVSAFAKLFEQYNNQNSVEMVEGNITYKLTPQGFKIADVSQHDNIIQLYQTTGEAWFYLYDGENARFKLPRENTEGKRYLYFYVGDYQRPQTEINIGILTELANGTDMEVIIDEINDAKDQAINELKASGVDWGSIKGVLSNQSDLSTALASKANTGDLLSSSASLQTQIDGLRQQVSTLQTEMTTMLARMDFSNSVEFTVNLNSSYTCPHNGYIQFNYMDNANNDIRININGRKFASGLSVGNGLTSLFPVSAGDVISMTSSSAASGNLQCVFIPQK